MANQLASLSLVDKLVESIVRKSGQLADRSEAIRQSWGWVHAAAHKFDSSFGVLSSVLPVAEKLGLSLDYYSKTVKQGLQSLDDQETTLKVLKTEYEDINKVLRNSTSAKQASMEVEKLTLKHQADGLRANEQRYKELLKTKEELKKHSQLLKEQEASLKVAELRRKEIDKLLHKIAPVQKTPPTPVVPSAAKPVVSHNLPLFKAQLDIEKAQIEAYIKEAGLRKTTLEQASQNLKQQVAASKANEQSHDELVKITERMAEINGLLSKAGPLERALLEKRRDDLKVSLQLEASIHRQDQLQNNVLMAMEKVGNTKKALMNELGLGLAAEAGLYALVLRDNAQLNRSMIEANSTLSTRFKLVDAVYQTQMATGASLDQLSSASRDLVAQGFEQKETFQSTLGIVVKMNSALGIGTQQGARLALVAKNIKTDFQGVANALATVIERTSITANEATRMAEQIGTSLLMLRQGGNADTLIREFSRIEDAVKQAGGPVGEWSKMMEGMMTTSQGAMNAHLMGLSPEALGKSGGSEEMFKRITTLIEKSTSGQGALGRIQIMEDWAAQLNTTPAMLNRMMEAQKKLNNQSKESIDLDKRWSNQMANSSETYRILYRSVMGLIHEAFLPLVTVTNYVGQSIIPVISYIGKFRTVVWGAFIVGTGFAAVSLIAVAKKTWDFSRALIGLIAALTAAELQAKRTAISSAAGKWAGAGKQILFDDKAEKASKGVWETLKGLLVKSDKSDKGMGDKLRDWSKVSQERYKASQKTDTSKGLLKTVTGWVKPEHGDKGALDRMKDMVTDIRSKVTWNNMKGLAKTAKTRVQGSGSLIKELVKGLWSWGKFFFNALNPVTKVLAVFAAGFAIGTLIDRVIQRLKPKEKLNYLDPSKKITAGNLQEQFRRAIRKAAESGNVGQVRTVSKQYEEMMAKAGWAKEKILMSQTETISAMRLASDFVAGRMQVKARENINPNDVELLKANLELLKLERAQFDEERAREVAKIQRERAARQEEEKRVDEERMYRETHAMHGTLIMQGFGGAIRRY